MRVGIVGYGNMGSAFAKAISGSLGREGIIVFEINQGRVEEALRDGFGVSRDIHFLIKESNLILIAVKPKDVRGVLNEIKDSLQDKVLVSIAAGIDTKTIEDIVGKDKKVIRMMPNINVLVGRGTIGIAKNGNVSEEEFLRVLELFSNCGTFYEIPEELFDSFTALAGSSPAFVFSFVDALAMAGVREGFSYDQALKIVLDTLVGSSLLVKELGGNPNEWITRVTSPGGTTVEGIAYLERKGFRGIVMRCVEKTSEKAKKLKG